MFMQMTENGITSVWRGGLKVGESISILTTPRSGEMVFQWEKQYLVRINHVSYYKCDPRYNLPLLLLKYMF